LRSYKQRGLSETRRRNTERTSPPEVDVEPDATDAGSGSRTPTFVSGSASSITHLANGGECAIFRFGVVFSAFMKRFLEKRRRLLLSELFS
jgi:hypothetical protein